MEKVNKTLVEAEEELYHAQKKYKELSRIEDAANRDKTSALNNLNNAQKEFDKIVDSIKNTSEWNTDWWLNKKNKKK